MYVHFLGICRAPHRALGPRHEDAEMTDLSPLGSHKLKLVQVSFFLHFEPVPLYISSPWTQNSEFFLGATCSVYINSQSNGKRPLLVREMPLLLHVHRNGFLSASTETDRGQQGAN